MLIVHMIGNAHIDPVWLWSWQEGVDEALATFRSAADRCDEYPEFIFTRGEAWLYQQLERLDPPLFARVRRLIERGQWHVTGGQYIQPDANLPTVMGWRRQFVHGRRYFQDRFGICPTVGYNVDSFGHPATLPDILAEHGYIGYAFHRPGAHQVELPATTFRWRGVEGSEVIGFRITPNYVTQSSDLYGQIMISADAADPALGHTMCFYGVGNHGGGPTKANIEYILEHAHAFTDIELRFSTPENFFREVLAQRDRLPVVTQELQHCFPGCYSVMHAIKQRQRHGEHLLDQSERLLNAFSSHRPERDGLQERIDRAWEDLLFTEFHDILAGTSVPSAWDSVRAMQGRARIAGEEVALQVTRSWARRELLAVDHHQVVVINADEEPWSGLVETEPWLDWDAWGDRWLSDSSGNAIPYQLVEPQTDVRKTRIIFPLNVAAQGYGYVLIRDDSPPPQDAVATDLKATPAHLANGRLRVDLGGGGIRHLIVDGQDVLGPGGLGLHLRQDMTDTWTFHTDAFTEPVTAVFEAEQWVVEETGPLRARARLEGRLGHSWIRWTISLHREIPRLDMSLEVNFGEQLTSLQMPINLATAPEHWRDGLPGGSVERSPGKTEWPVQGWSRVRVGDRHIALITNDAYSLSLDGDRWQWTLLRSPRMAWMGATPEIYAGHDVHTDWGMHVFHVTLIADDTIEEARLHTAARQQAQPPIVFSRYEGLNRPPWQGIPPRGVWGPAEERMATDGEPGYSLPEKGQDSGMQGFQPCS